MNTLQLILEFLQSNAAVSIVTAVVTLASSISAVTGTPKEGTVLAKVYSLLDFLALNIGRAKEK
jgi:hypothetical protein